MKNQVVYGFLVFLIAIVSGCTLQPQEEHTSPVGQFLKGEHELRKLVPTYSSTPDHVEGSFFLGFGDFSGKGGVSQPGVTFAWLTNDGKSYQISTLPLSKIRVSFDKRSTPTVKFRWRPHYTMPNMDDLMITYVKYATITCSEEDWPPYFKMPLNQSR